MKAKLVLVVAGSFCIASCAEPDATVYARLPVVAACEADVIANIATISGDRYSADYVSFDTELVASPYVTGFLQTSSSSMARAELVQYANGLIQECMPRYGSEYPLDDSDQGKALFDFLAQVQEGRVRVSGVEGYSGVVDPEEVYLFFRDDKVTARFNVITED